MIHGTWEPEPPARWEDGFLSGNGRHGALVHGFPHDERVIVTHHTLVRPNGSEQAGPPELADRLADVRARLLAGDTTAAEGFTDGRELLWVQPFHPAFQTRLRPPAAPGGRADGHTTVAARYRRSVDFATGVVHTTASDPGTDSRVFVSRADDVIVQHVGSIGPDRGGRGREGRLTADLTLDHRLPGAPAGLHLARHSTVTSEGALLTLHVRYPSSDTGCARGTGDTGTGDTDELGGLGYTGVTLAVVAGGRTTAATEGIRVAGAYSLLLLTRVHRHRGAPDVAEQAESLRALLPRPAGDDATTPQSVVPRPVAAYAQLLGRHEALHRTAYQRVTLELDADPRERELPGSALLRRPASPALLERLFAAGRYHLLSSSGLFPPRLTGLWTGDWDTAWSGAFTTNANLNLQTASATAAALPEVLEAHGNLVYGQLPDWRANARAVFAARGILAPSHTDGEHGRTVHFQRAYPLHLWTAGADWMLKPLLDHAETIGDTDPRLLSALAEAGLFHQDFLAGTDSATPDGRYAFVPSYSPENRPANASWGTVNATMDIAAARHALTVSGRTDVAAKLPPYRVNDDGALAEWAWPGLAETYDHRHLSHLYPVWPLDEINPYDTPELAVAAHRALEQRGAENDSAHGHLHHALVAARLGDAPRVAHALSQVLEADFFHTSLMSSHYPHRDVYNADAAHTLPAVVIESLVHSTPDRLVLFPACSHRAGRLTGIRTRFGATLDLTWADGEATAHIRPSRPARVDLRTPGGAQLLALRAGDDLVLTLSTRRTTHAVRPLPPLHGRDTPWHVARRSDC